MISSTWFWTATGSGAACAVLAAVVIVSGWRRRLPEVVFLGTGLFVVSVFATAHGLSGTTLADAGPSRWAAVVALPLGIAATLPLLAPRRGWAGWWALHWRPWVLGWVLGALVAGFATASTDRAPPAALVATMIVVGVAGALTLARRQVWLHQVSGRGSALVVAGAVATIAATSTAAALVQPAGAAAWVVLGIESLGVFAAGFAVLVGYRTETAVTDVLGPVLAFEPLAALEVGMAPELHAFVAALERIDPITRDHVVRTSTLAMRVASRCRPAGSGRARRRHRGAAPRHRQAGDAERDPAQAGIPHR